MNRFKFPFFRPEITDLRTERNELLGELELIKKSIFEHERFRKEIPDLYERFLKFVDESLTGANKLCDLVPTEKNWHSIATARAVQKAIRNIGCFFETNLDHLNTIHRECIDRIKELDEKLKGDQ